MNRKERRQLAKQRKQNSISSPMQMPEKIVRMLEQALNHQSSGEVDQAIAIYRQVLLIDPNNSFAKKMIALDMIKPYTELKSNFKNNFKVTKTHS